MARSCLLKFCCNVLQEESLQCVFARKILKADARRVAAMHEVVLGMAGMIGCLDHTHICWKKCPVACKDHRLGKRGSQQFYLLFWHLSFELPGSLNDPKMRDQSSLLKSFLDVSLADGVNFEFKVRGQVFINSGFEDL